MSITVHPLLHDSILLNGAKRTMLQRNIEQIDTLAVGSSHGDFGFNPHYFPNSFNLCCRSQDLKHSFLLYKNLTEKFPKIKNVILFYSLFSPGSFLERSPSEKYISPALNELFDLNIEYDDKELHCEHEKIKGRLNTIVFESNGINGFLPNYFKDGLPEDYGATRRATEHLKISKKEEANLYLIRLLLLAKHRNHKVCIAVPPVRSDYKKAIGSEFNVLFKSLLEVLYCYHLGCEVSLVNCFNEEMFYDDHFIDYDHLLPLGKGTELFTRLIFKSFEKF